MSQTIEGIRYEVSEHIATLTLDKPERRNSFDLKMIDEWVRRLREADSDPSVRVVVITGAGSAFCAGADLGEIFQEDPTPMGRKDRLAHHIQQVGLHVSRMDKPVIAAVNGPAVGAGMDMALMCDFRIASSTARIGATYVKVGVMPGNGAAHYLPRLVGQSRALELLLTGRTLDADEALRLGIVSSIVAPEDLMDEARAVAGTIVSYPPVLVQMIKRTVRHSAVSPSLEGSLDLVSSAAALIHSSRAALGD